MSVNRPTNIDSVLGVTHRSYSSGVIGSRRLIRSRCWRIRSVIWIQRLTLSTSTGYVSRASTIEADYPVSRCSDCFLHWVCDMFASCRRAVGFPKFVQLPMYSRLHILLPLTLVHEEFIELRLYLPRPITFLCSSSPIQICAKSSRGSSALLQLEYRCHWRPAESGCSVEATILPPLTEVQDWLRTRYLSNR